MNDGWGLLTGLLRYFTFSKYFLMSEQSRVQLFWLLARLLALGAQGCDALIIGLLRQYRSGSHDPQNLKTLAHIIGLLNENTGWLYSQPGLIPYVLYPLLRAAAEDGLDVDLRDACLALCHRLLFEKVSSQCTSQLISSFVNAWCSVETWPGASRISADCPLCKPYGNGY